MPKSITAYTDLRSPYTFVALAAAYRLETDFEVALDWYPYTTALAAAFGAADGRNSRELRKVKYAYMNVRRMAEPQGLVIRGTKRIFDPTVGHVGLLQARRDGVLRAYHDRAFARVFRRELDPDDRIAIRALISEVGGDGDCFDALLDGDGPAELARINAAAETEGVFGVPSFLLDGELFWGNESIPLLRRRLDQE